LQTGQEQPQIPKWSTGCDAFGDSLVFPFALLFIPTLHSMQESRLFNSFAFIFCYVLYVIA
jgi:hypothetical protein